MIDTEKRQQKEDAKEKTRKRIRVQLDKDNYEFIPATKKKTDYYDNETNQRVGIYVRVSTNDVRQTTSFELQKRFYEDFVLRHPKWTLFKIYADEGISGTSLNHRDQFKQMIADAKDGLIDLIITKSVSRFARNVMITIGMVRELASLKHPVGVFFESECIFSLNDDSQMALSFLSTMAEEESRTRSRSMESSLRMRLDNGLPLTPKLLGYTHDENGNLIINPDEAPTVKLIFYMYLYGYSSQQIANALLALERKSYLGNTNKWSPNIVIEILRNERHCGDVITRKTITVDFHDHRHAKNRGDVPQSHYKNHHEAIISRDDFIAVQHMINNAKYKNKSFLPELRVIEQGLLKGYVVVNPRWSGFTAQDYIKAALSVYDENEVIKPSKIEEVAVNAGEFDMRGFEITRGEFFNPFNQPSITIMNDEMYFSAACAKTLDKNNYIELLINPLEMKLAIRPTVQSNKQGIYCSKLKEKLYRPRSISITAFSDALHSILEWNKDYKYKIIGTLLERADEKVYIFEAINSEVFFHSYVLPEDEIEDNERSTLTPLSISGKRVGGFPEEWTNSFGKDFYTHELSYEELAKQSEREWLSRIEGRLFDSGRKIKITPYEELKAYINKELEGIDLIGESV